MKLLIIVGNSATGKMTVGQELMKITGLRLFHNHMTIEPVIEVFGYYDSQVVMRLREVFFEEFAESDGYGLIFTFMWAFDQQSDWDYINHLCDIFRKEGADIYLTELVASQEVRLQRNTTENRLHNKPSKRNLESSEKRLLADDRRYCLESYEGEVPFDNYIKIDNSDIEPAVVAAMIKESFGL